MTDLTRDRALLIGALIGSAAWSLGAQGATALLPYLVGCAGLAAIHERLRLEFDRDMSLVTTLVLFAGTSLFWSMTRPAGLAEAVTFALVAIALLVASRLTPSRAVWTASWVAVAAIPIVVRLASREAAGASSPGWTALLFSSSDGVLSLTPVVYVALVGTLVACRRRPWALPALAVCACWVIVATVLPPGRTDGRFGHGLTAALAVLAPGLADLVERARARPWMAIAVLTLGAVVWNYWLMVQYTTGAIPKDAPLSFAVMVRQQADVQTRSPYVYPFALPANVWFAWREGVPVDRYDVLAAEPRRDAIDLTMTRDAARFLFDGWEARASDAADPYVWIRDRRATLALPLALPPGREVDVIVTARARLEEPPVSATLGLEVNGREVGRFVVPPAAPVDVRLRVPSEIGGVWRAGYNRLAFVSYGVEPLDPDDRRPPGPLARRTGDRAWPVAIYRLRVEASEPQ